MKYDAVIIDLPLPINICGDDISIEYVKELKLVSTEDELEAFTIKWNMVWRLPYGESKKLSKIEESIVNNTYDKTEALKCIRKCRDKVCSHIKNSTQCAGVDILLPQIFLICYMISKHYGAPFMVALIQLQKSLNNLPECVAFHVF